MGNWGFLTRSDYDALIATNWSSLSSMADSPANYKHRLDHPREDTDVLRLGRAVHTCTFEPRKFELEYARWEGGTRRGKDWDNFQAAHKTQVILTDDQWQTAMQMAASVLADPVAREFITDGEAEVSHRWEIERPFGIVDCKGRLDYLKPEWIVDLKSTVDASQRAFGAQAFGMRWHGQAAWYTDGDERIHGRRRRYMLVAIEKTEAMIPQCYEVGESELMLGRELYERLLDEREECRRSGVWSGYSTGVLPLRLPRWAWPDVERDLADMNLKEAGE